MRKMYGCNVFLLVVVFCFYSCKKNDVPSVPFNSVDYFLSTINHCGLIVENDSSKIVDSEYCRTIQLFNAVRCIATHPGRYTVDITKKNKIRPEELITGLQMVKDSNGLTLCRIIKLGIRADAELEEWTAAFYKDSLLFKINQKAMDFRNLLWFARKFCTVVFSQSTKSTDSLLALFKNEQEQVYFNSKILEKMHNGKMVKNDWNGTMYNCYKGEYILSPIDTLTPLDSADFRNCIIEFRREHGLSPTFTIDSTLLNALNIPLHPIEEGLKTYHLQSRIME